MGRERKASKTDTLTFKVHPKKQHQNQPPKPKSNKIFEDPERRVQKNRCAKTFNIPNPDELIDWSSIDRPFCSIVSIFFTFDICANFHSFNH